MFFFRKHLRNENVFQTKVKTIFVFETKRIQFANKSESLSETKIKFFETKMFLFRKYLQNASVFETKVNLF